MPTGTWRRLEGQTVACLLCGREVPVRQEGQQFCGPRHRMTYHSLIRKAATQLAGFEAAFRRLLMQERRRLNHP